MTNHTMASASSRTRSVSMRSQPFTAYPSHRLLAYQAPAVRASKTAAEALTGSTMSEKQSRCLRKLLELLSCLYEGSNFVGYFLVDG